MKKIPYEVAKLTYSDLSKKKYGSWGYIMDKEQLRLFKKNLKYLKKCSV